MQKRTYSTILLLLFLVGSLGAQTKLSGKIIDENGSPIAFVRMGVVGSSVAKMSSEEGAFAISIPYKYQQERLTLQVPGFVTTSFSIDSLSTIEKVQLKMKTAVQQLANAEVTTKKYRPKSKKVGNRGMISGGGASYGGQWTVVVLAEVPKNKVAQVMKVRFNMSIVKRDSMTLRPVVFAYDEAQNRPGEELMKVNIISKLAQKKGWVEMDISDHTIFVSGKFCVGFEILSGSDTDGDVFIAHSFGGALSTKQVWQRSNMSSKWREASNSYSVNARIEY